MTVGDSQPTLPLPDPDRAYTSQAPRRRVWPWLVTFGVVVALGIVAWFAVESAARDIVEGAIADEVRDQLSLPASQEIEVGIDGAVIPQLVRGSFDEITLASEDVAVGSFVGDVVVTAQGVPIRGGALAGAQGEVRVDSAQLQRLLSGVEGFPAESADISGGEVTISTELSVLGVAVPVGVGLVPSAAEGALVLTPQSLQVAGADISAEGLRDQFGVVADLVLRDWTVCIAERMPAGLTLTSAAVDGGELVAQFAVDGNISVDATLREPGSCEPPAEG
ncbi:LmeA family phospholipid-binding protein [Microbacterium hominis]|uniref:DUF2993 domain-containing protein n=1 Tax=Microbacterium hominis TaxID=162426 RepID=A0A7D4Q354_9MICO|nr:DUF2993 domain-containing protein [Microbacterium hominis]QKJ19911.1 DUF2993 domain-containing protein [Microbacterium hominis]